MVLLSVPTFLWIIISGALHNFNMTAATSFMTAFLARYHAVNLKTAAFAAAVIFGVSGLIGLLAGGWAADRFSHKRKDGRLLLSAITLAAAVPCVLLALRQPGGAVVSFVLLMGVGLGLLSGFAGGKVDALIMRICDVMLSFPSILVALLIDGVGRAMFPNAHDTLAFGVLIVAISLTGWVQYARTVRGSTLGERQKEYVQAARVIGVRPLRIMFAHVLPNVTGPVLVLATIHVAAAILTEATLSFLGVGVPPTSPSLGTLIRIGNDFLFSGEWWITIFPGLMLVLIALSVNLLGDWLRDALNPRLR